MDTTRLKTEIDIIYNAYAEGSVTNEMVAGVVEGVLEYVESLSGKQDSLYNSLTKHIARFDALLEGNASTAIDNFNEVLAFLEGMTDNETLVAKLNSIRLLISDLQRTTDDVTLGLKDRIDTLSKKTCVKDIDVKADENSVEIVRKCWSIDDEEDVDGLDPVYIPKAIAPVGSTDMTLPFPGQAGIVSAADFGRFDRGAKYAETMLDRLKERKVVEELEAEATAQEVKIVQHRWRPDGGRDISLADAGGDVAAQSDDAGVAPQANAGGGGNAVEGGVEINQHPHDITLALPVASTEQAGVMTAAQVAKLESAGEAGFRELWTSAYGCTVDDAAPASERYVCNKLGMSLAEAKQTYAAGQLGCQLGGAVQYRGLQIRTNLPPYPFAYAGQYSLAQAFSNNSKLEVAAATFAGQKYMPSSWDSAFGFCARLHTVIGPVDKPVANTFYKCDRLENVTFALDANCKSFSLGDCPLISLASMQTIPAGSAKRTAQISVTVHADVYAKLTDPEGHPEWVQVVLDAADKNIIFTTV